MPGGNYRFINNGNRQNKISMVFNIDTVTQPP